MKKMKNSDKERRFYPASDLKGENRVDGKKKIKGYSAVFNRLSEDLGGFREKIKPGAFKKALKDSDVVGLFNHNPDHVLGRQSNNTLELEEDNQGLWMQIDLPDTSFAHDLWKMTVR